MVGWMHGDGVRRERVFGLGGGFWNWRLMISLNGLIQCYDRNVFHGDGWMQSTPSSKTSIASCEDEQKGAMLL